jgi:SET domain-containing protein
MLPDNYDYKPIPYPLLLKKSKIHGYGIFSLETFKEESIITESPTHLVCGDSFTQTPIGGFINHSDKPNSTFIKEGNSYKLKSLTKVRRGEEITVDYNKEFCGGK